MPDVRSTEPLRDIREAIREREAAYVPPRPLERSAAPVGAAAPAEPAQAEPVSETDPDDSEPPAGTDGDDSSIS